MNYEGIEWCCLISIFLFLTSKSFQEGLFDTNQYQIVTSDNLNDSESSVDTSVILWIPRYYLLKYWRNVPYIDYATNQSLDILCGSLTQVPLVNVSQNQNLKVIYGSVKVGSIVYMASKTIISHSQNISSRFFQCYIHHAKINRTQHSQSLYVFVNDYKQLIATKSDNNVATLPFLYTGKKEDDINFIYLAMFEGQSLYFPCFSTFSWANVSLHGTKTEVFSKLNQSSGAFNPFKGFYLEEPTMRYHDSYTCTVQLYNLTQSLKIITIYKGKIKELNPFILIPFGDYSGFNPWTSNSLTCFVNLYSNDHVQLSWNVQFDNALVNQSSFKKFVIGPTEEADLRIDGEQFSDEVPLTFVTKQLDIEVYSNVTTSHHTSCTVDDFNENVVNVTLPFIAADSNESKDTFINTFDYSFKKINLFSFYGHPIQNISKSYACQFKTPHTLKDEYYYYITWVAENINCIQPIRPKNFENIENMEAIINVLSESQPTLSYELFSHFNTENDLCPLNDNDTSNKSVTTYTFNKTTDLSSSFYHVNDFGGRIDYDPSYYFWLSYNRTYWINVTDSKRILTIESVLELDYAVRADVRCQLHNSTQMISDLYFPAEIYQEVITKKNGHLNLLSYLFATTITLILLLFLTLIVRQRLHTIRMKKNLKCLEYVKPPIIKTLTIPSFDSSKPTISFDSALEFPRDRINLGPIIGHGTFGKVFEAFVIGLTPEESRTKVAIKTIQGVNDVNHFQTLISEFKIMLKLGKHPNIVNLLGVCSQDLQDMSFMIIMEFCAYGNLKDHLKKNRELYTSANENTSYDLSPVSNSLDIDKCQTQTTLTYSVLLSYAYQIAKGMDFLASKKFIHRDLACRNVLLHHNNSVKIGDFGLSKHLYSYNYVKSSKTPIPVKWMALEALLDNEYSIKSDIWSFGVVLWEIFSLGHSPYPEYEPGSKFIEALQKGVRLSKPQHASDDLYKIMQECWHVRPHVRPTFHTLVQNLAMAIMEYNKSKDMPNTEYCVDNDYFDLDKVDEHQTILNRTESVKDSYIIDFNNNQDRKNKDNSKKGGTRVKKQNSNNNNIFQAKTLEFRKDGCLFSKILLTKNLSSTSSNTTRLTRLSERAESTLSLNYHWKDAPSTLLSSSNNKNKYFYTNNGFDTNETQSNSHAISHYRNYKTL